MLGEYEGARDRRTRDRRNISCIYPDCHGATDIEQTYKAISNALNELKEGQRQLLKISTEVAGMTQAVTDLRADVEDIKDKLEDKLNRRDAILWGAIIMGVLTALQVGIFLHGNIK